MRRVQLTGWPAGALLCASSLLLAQQRQPTLFERVGSFGLSLNESSGVAVSRKHPGILWTHNDSGDGPYLFATELDGTLVGLYEVMGARAVDWEDIALAPCPIGPSDCLYVGDTGDNEERRGAVTLYIVPEPDTLESGAGGRARPVRSAWAVRFTYPDGPHDVEALWVGPDGAVELVTKGRVGAVRHYRVPRPSLISDTATAEAVGTVPIVTQRSLGRRVTGAAIAPSNQRVAIRTYAEIFFFLRNADGALAADGPPCWLGLREAQGEAVAFLDEDTLVLTSEGASGQAAAIHRARC